MNRAGFLRGLLAVPAVLTSVPKPAPEVRIKELPQLTDPDAWLFVGRTSCNTQAISTRFIIDATGATSRDGRWGPL